MVMIEREFPVIHSLLSPHALASLVERYYAVEPHVECILLNLGVNDTYLVRTTRCKYIMRVYRKGHRSRDDVDFELALLQHLARAGIRVSTPVETRRGDY